MKYGRKSGKLIERKVKEKAATYAIDKRGRKKTVNEAGKNEQIKRSNSYNGDGENALTYSYNYDDAGRISDALVESGSKGSKGDFRTLQNTYDNAGRISTFSYRYEEA